MPGGYVPEQSLVLLITDSKGHIMHSGLRVTPYTIYATYTEDAGRSYHFQDSETEGLHIRKLDELTQDVWAENHAMNPAVDFRKKGLVPWPRFLTKISMYEHLQTLEIGGVYWTPQSTLKTLDQAALNYKVLKTIEGHHAPVRLATRAETIARLEAATKALRIRNSQG